MKKFNKVVVLNKTNLTEETKKKIQKYSEDEVVYFESEPKNADETLGRIGDADAVLGSFHLKIGTDVLKQSSNLKYVGVCGTNLKEIDLDEAIKLNIAVNNVTDYGDEATAEYIFIQLANLFRGWGDNMLEDEPKELNSKIIGIIGLGAVGKQVARIALGYGMKVLYFSNSRKLDWEDKGVLYTTLDDLLSKSEIISINVSKDTKILGKKELNKIGNKKVIVDTCLGSIYKDFDAMRSWLKKKDNFLIRDHNDEIKSELEGFEGFIYTDKIIAGMTRESRESLGVKVLENIKSFLKKC